MPERPESLVTIGDVHLAAMREHERKAALLHWEGGRWEETPDWRLDRHVIRLGLYLRERAGLLPGERIAILSAPRREWLLADLAAAVQGAVAVALDPDLPEPALSLALAEIAPRVLFVSGPPVLERLGNVLQRGTSPRATDRGDPMLPGTSVRAADLGQQILADDGGINPGNIISFDGPAEGAALLSEVLDLGGTLDTAERAVAFRARAREVSPEQRAFGYVACAEDGSIALRFQAHREVVAHLRALWSREPARKGDLAYVAGSAMTPGLRLALLAFVGDGLTTVAFGNRGREVEEIAELRPHKIVAPPGPLDAAVVRGPVPRDAKAGVRGWLEQAVSRMPLSRERASRQTVSAALGGRARWVRPTAALTPAASELMRGALKIDLDVDSTRGGAA